MDSDSSGNPRVMSTMANSSEIKKKDLEFTKIEIRLCTLVTGKRVDAFNKIELITMYQWQGVDLPKTMSSISSNTIKKGNMSIFDFLIILWLSKLL